MKRTLIILAAAVSAYGIQSCVKPEEISFGTDTDSIELEATGGIRNIELSSPGEWVAKTQEPWITVSPANGVGSVQCNIIVDSALTASPREGIVRLERLSGGERKDIVVKQKGFEYVICADKQEVSLASYAAYGERSFEVKVSANTPFEVVIPESAASWLSCEQGELILDRGVRPRNCTLSFEWNLNVYQDPREVTVSLVPKDQGLSLARCDAIDVRQSAAEEIEIGIKGDSLALVSINRALGCWQEFETSERMANWKNVTVWESGPNKGRVRSAAFMLFETKEGLPFQVKYLTAAESLTFFSNSNTFLKDLEPGEFISELTQLRRLTISAYGLSTLPDYFKKLSNLEYLDISGNNFQTIPEILTPENFPKLTALIMNANTRSNIYDLSNTTETRIGGFVDECTKDENGERRFPVRMLKWNKLDTLRLSVNFLQGSLPDFEDDPEIPRWTAEEVNACDTLPSRLIGLPKVMPDTDFLAINLNKLSGELPDWLLFHPKLDLWIPFSLVFPQEGKDSDGRLCGFSNEPANLDYYYAEYVNKKYNPNNQ